MTDSNYQSITDDPRVNWGPGEWYDETVRLEAEVERVNRELHQVHLNYHHMVDEAQRLRGILSQTAHDIGEEGFAKWSSDLHRAIHAALDEEDADASR